MAKPLFTLQTYTPNSDLAVGFNQSQVIWGRSGNDTFLGLQPIITAKRNQVQFDVFIGDVALDDPALRQWSDTFVLGEWNEPYYSKGDPNTFGLNDFALIADFNPQLDFIQLYGNASNYQLIDVGLGTAIALQTQSGLDVVGFLLGNSNLSLGHKSFQFKGTTPPRGPVFSQAEQLGSLGFDIRPVVATDPFNNVYVAGGTTGSLGGANNADSRDALIAKYDSQGNRQLIKQFGTADFDTIYGIATDKQGFVYVAGTTEGDLAKPKQASTADAFVAKYDGNGNRIWIQQFGGELITSAFSLDVDANSNVYLSGISVRSAPEVVTDDFWVTKYDTNGNRIWFNEFGSPAFDEPYAVTVSNDGSVYAGGWSLGDFAQKNAGVYDAAIAKLDNNGQIEWKKQFGTPDYEWTWGLDTDSQGNLYAAGWTLGNLAGQNAGSYDNWIAKFDKQGNQLWAKQFGSAGDDETFRMTIDSSDNIFVTGYTNGNLAGANAGSFDAWAARYDTNGNQVWTKQFGTSEFDQAYGISSDNAGNLYVSGMTQGSFGGTNAGSFDSWVAKLDVASGNLKDFSGSSQATSVFSMASPLTGTTSTQRSTDKQGSKKDSTEYIKNFFQKYVTETLGLTPGSGGPQGVGLETLVSAPYRKPGSRPSDDKRKTLVGTKQDDFLVSRDRNYKIMPKEGNDTIMVGNDQDLVVLGRGDGTDTIFNFGGVGTSSRPSKETIEQVDRIKFEGPGLTAKNMLLAQEGEDLKISFEGINDTQVILKSFRLENLNNLRQSTGASVDLDNIEFSGQSKKQGSLDVISAKANPSRISNSNSVTFLNDLDNKVSGFDNSNDVINGQGGKDTLIGLSGDDLLRGGSGNDVLIGGRGQNVLIGGSGADKFALETGGTNTITDFSLSEGDRLALSAGLNFNQLKISQGTGRDASNSLIMAASNNELLAIMTGVQANTLTSGVFTNL